jgi:hypothetical protein
MMRVVSWNVEWATPASVRSPCILDRLAEHSPNLVCRTETERRLLSAWDGHTIANHPDPRETTINNRRKVLLWSRRKWTKVDDFGDEALPPGRSIADATETPAGPGTVIGVCIPYHNANVNVGAKNKAPWEDHSAYLGGLASMLTRKVSGPLIVMSNFNEQIGQGRRSYPPVSHPVRAELLETMAAAGSTGLAIATAGRGLRGRRTIDHTAISGELSDVSLTTIDNMDGDRRLSDHFGVVADPSTGDPPQNPPQTSDFYDNQQSSLELAPDHRG